MINHLSFSSVSRYLRCGKQWKYHYLDNLPEEDSESLLFGRAWHKLIKLADGSDLLDYWSAVAAENGLNDDLMHLGNRMLQQEEIAATIQGLSINPEMLEMRTELTIPGVSVPVIGFIDMIGNDGVPIDIKTSSRKWTQDQVDRDLQATFYLAALEQLGMVTLPAKFRFIVFTKTKKPDVSFHNSQH